MRIPKSCETECEGWTKENGCPQYDDCLIWQEVLADMQFDEWKDDQKGELNYDR